MAIVPLTLYALTLSESVGDKPNATAAGTYNGSVITNGYTKPAGVNVTGDESGTNAGTYTAIYTPDSDHEWSDGTQDAVTVTLTIERAYVGARPGDSITKNYTGGSLDNGYTTPAGVNVSGSTSGVLGGTYTATYTPDANHKWNDETITSASRTLTIQYVWQKWDSVAHYAEATETQTLYGGGVWQALTYGTYASRAYYDPVFDSSIGQYNYSPYDYSQGSVYCGPYYWGSTVNSTSRGNVNAIVKGSKTIVIYRTGRVEAYEDGATTVTKKYGVIGGYSKGSTNYGNISNTSNIYPENGRHSDGFWYVKTW